MCSDAIETEPIFSCQQCGDCCKGYGGTYLTEADIRRISEFIQEEPELFLAKYCRMSGKRPLLAQAENGYCIFFNQNCSIHPVKPFMCRAWPYISGVLKDPNNWYAMAGSCPGMKRDVSIQTIVEVVADELQKISR
jgi:Fe-S-cluster containining protein